MEWAIMWMFLIISIILSFFLFRKQPVHDWVTVYLLITLITCMTDRYLISIGCFEYPVRFFDKYYNTSILFDHIFFPVICVLYNQTTYKSSFAKIIIQTLFYSGTLTLIEVMFEKYTRLIDYHNWSGLHSFITLSIAFLIVRGFIGFIRRVSR